MSRWLWHNVQQTRLYFNGITGDRRRNNVIIWSDTELVFTLKSATTLKPPVKWTEWHSCGWLCPEYSRKPHRAPSPVHILKGQSCLVSMRDYYNIRQVVSVLWPIGLDLPSNGLKIYTKSHVLEFVYRTIQIWSILFNPRLCSSADTELQMIAVAERNEQSHSNGIRTAFKACFERRKLSVVYRYTSVQLVFCV